jgi:hypothetical protein
MANARCPRLFTWIEWFAVIGIIALLAGMVFPPIIKAHRGILLIACADFCGNPRAAFERKIDEQ